MKTHMRNAVARVAKFGAPPAKAKAKARLKKAPVPQKAEGTAPMVRLDKAPRKAVGGPMTKGPPPMGGPMQPPGPQMLGPPIQAPPMPPRPPMPQGRPLGRAEGGGIMDKMPRVVTDFADDVKQTWKGHMTPGERGGVKGFGAGVAAAVAGAEALRMIGDAMTSKTGKDMTGTPKATSEPKPRGKRN